MLNLVKFCYTGLISEISATLLHLVVFFFIAFAVIKHLTVFCFNVSKTAVVFKQCKYT